MCSSSMQGLAVSPFCAGPQAGACFKWRRLSQFQKRADHSIFPRRVRCTCSAVPHLMQLLMWVRTPGGKSSALIGEQINRHSAINWQPANQEIQKLRICDCLPILEQSGGTSSSSMVGWNAQDFVAFLKWPQIDLWKVTGSWMEKRKYALRP
jgi:hypothetical protein